MTYKEPLSNSFISDTWFISLAPWILADGNYWNGEYCGFYKTQVTQFALEVSPLSITPAHFQEKQVTHKRDTTYLLTGEIVFVWENGWVIDFGIQAYFYSRSKLPRILQLQSFVTLEAHLGIDHSAYSDFLCKVPGIPPLVYQWHIQSVTQEIYPLVRQTTIEGRDYFLPDTTNTKYIEQENTRNITSIVDSHQDLFPHAEKLDYSFILKCQIQSLERNHSIK